MHREEWYEYLRFTKAQQYMIIGFLILNIGIKLLPHFPFYSKIKSSMSVSHISRDVDVVNNDNKKSRDSNIQSSTKKRHLKSPRISAQNIEHGTKNKKYDHKKHNIPAFKFDPNTISEDSIQLLDIPQGAKRNWIKYRNSGGEFYTAQSMSKIFGMTDNDYAYLEKSIHISSKRGVKKKKYSTAIISINKASLKEWQTIRGIGPYYAKNILKYKESLGGFVDLQQLKEVYRLPDSTYNNMLPRLALDSFKPIYNINMMSQQALFQHPYISYKQAKSIVKFRIQHGDYMQIEDLEKIISLDKSFIDKIKPYFVTTNDGAQKNLLSVD